MKGIDMYNAGLELIAKGERLKSMGTQKLKSLLGTAQAGSAGGWKASWVTWKPQYSLKIKVDSERALKEVGKTVERLIGVDGVVELKPEIRPEARHFRVDEIRK
jgi:hypothetical protein